ncbi:MAG TPA: superoxide dismutase family protein [Micromonosporaceae bacterium]|nr:superoxide dismutase family protein [Micromonosporaceae bacterium]
MDTARTPRIARAARSLAALAVLAGAGPLLAPSAIAAMADDPRVHGTARAVVRNVDGAALGVVKVTGTRAGRLVIGGRLTGLTPGVHGFHVHATGRCDPAATDAAGNAAPFATAGGHLNPAGVDHGRHAGDLPVLLAGRDGAARSTVQSDAVTFADIFDADGSALVVHALPDNYANVPTRYSSAAGRPGPDATTLGTGDSGGRVACGVITRS